MRAWAKGINLYRLSGELVGHTAARKIPRSGSIAPPTNCSLSEGDLANSDLLKAKGEMTMRTLCDDHSGHLNDVGRLLRLRNAIGRKNTIPCAARGPHRLIMLATWSVLF